MSINQLSCSPNGQTLIKKFEGLRLTAYQDMVGVWAIGYGHTGPDVKPGLTITQQQADQLLINDLVRFNNGVNALVTVKLNQNQFDALVSFSYNLGLGSLQNSTLLRLLNQGGDNYDAGDAGTTFRFLTAYLALQPGTQMLTGSARPISHMSMSRSGTPATWSG